MDLKINGAERRFRSEVREFALANISESVRIRVLYGEKLDKHEYVDWQRRLYQQGWIAPSWPVEYGGTGWSLAQRRVFHHELALCCAPETISFGISMVGPVIYTFGSAEQKQKYLPGIRQSDTWWCQGFSEPNAGSDLASLKTRAQDKGDHYVVSGQKTWTTHARHADLMFCLARTSEEEKLQDGISFLLLDMKAPGVEVRSIDTIDEGASICEVFLNDVVVPKADLIGTEGRGWDYAKFLLGHERAMIARVGRSRMQLDRARRIASSQGGYHGPLSEAPQFQARLAELEARLRALEMSELRALSEYQASTGFDPATASILKIEGSELCQQLTQLLLDLNGRYSRVYLGRYAQSPVGSRDAYGTMGDHLFNRVATIYGGSTEVQKNIIAKSRL